MAGGLNDLELETLQEVNLSPQLAARPPPAVPARRARRIVSGVALGVTLVLALITWVSLRVDTPPKARAAPDLARGRGARDRDARDHAPAPPRRRRRVVVGPPVEAPRGGDVLSWGRGKNCLGTETLGIPSQGRELAAKKPEQSARVAPRR